MKRVSNSAIPRPSTSSGRLSLGPLRVRDENIDSGTGATGGRARSSFGVGGARSSFGQLRAPAGGGLIHRGRSVGGARGTTPAKKRITGTTGTTPAKSSRRSSGYGSRATGPTILSDPRNLRNKAWQAAAVQKLLEFLQVNDYSHSISAKMLSCPQAKDFVAVFEFLMGFLDPGFKIEGRMEEEVPRVLKLYRYPYPILSMSAVITTLTWPPILGALDWLAESVKKHQRYSFDNLLIFRSSEDFDKPKPSQECAWNYYTKTYEQFLAGANSFEELEEELGKQIRADGLSEKLEKSTEENRRLKETLHELETMPDRLTEVRENQAKLSADLEKMTRYNAELDKHAMKVRDKGGATDEQLQTMSAKYDALNREAVAKRNIVETQEFSRADVMRINRNKQSLIGQRDLLQKEIGNLNEEVWDSELKLTRQQEKSDKLCSEYSRKAHVNKLIPSSAENAFGLDIELKTTSQWHNANIVSDVKPALLELKKTWKGKNHEMNEKVTTVRDVCEQVDDMLTDKEDSAAKLQTKVTRVDKDIQVKKEESAQEISRLEQELEKSREALEQSQRDMKRQGSDLEDLRRQLQQTKISCEQDENIRKKESLDTKNLLLEAMEAICNHKAKMQKESAKLLAKCRDRAFKERDTLLAEGKPLPWEQPGYTGELGKSILPRWVEGRGLVIPVKGGWHPVESGVPLAHLAQLGVGCFTGSSDT